MWSNGQSQTCLILCSYGNQVETSLWSLGYTCIDLSIPIAWEVEANFNITKKNKIFDFLMEQHTMLYLMEPSRVNLNRFKPLIVWNNPFGVDDRFKEKPDCWFAQAGTENSSRVKFFKMSLFFRCYSHIFAITNQFPGFSISRYRGLF